MRSLLDILNEGFFSGDEDCWVDENGTSHDLDRSSRETHRDLAHKMLAGQIQPEDDAVKAACRKGWIRIWVEGAICFVALDYKNVSRKAVRATADFLRKAMGVTKVWVEDSASPTYEEFTDIKRACGYLTQLTVKRDLNFMFETEKLDEIYSEPNTFLKRHISGGDFDYYRYWQYAYMWAQQSGEMDEIEELLGDAPQEDEPEQYALLTPALQKDFKEWVMDYLNGVDPTELPSSHYFSNQATLIPRNSWLVHFSDNAHGIISSGFTHGTMDADQLGLTTYTSHASKQGGGYNFAFLATGRDAQWAAQKGKYGKDFVMFQNSGVKAYHYSDEEDQVMFWGPDVDKRHIALVVQVYGEYEVLSRTGIVLFKGDFEPVVKWVIAHHRQYSNQLYG